jgi:Zn-dependent peptidase ImmA (M78 family)
VLGVFRMVMVFKVRMPDGVAARTDGKDIWVDDRLNEVQERCAIAHELIHVERGHSTTQVEAVEMGVRFETAKRLLPLDVLFEGCRRGGSLAVIARNLGVTRQVLMDRAATLTDQQAETAGCGSCRACPVMEARMANHPAYAHAA